MNEKQAMVSAVSRSRLETLFDGVFAIAITVLVLELKIPELVDPHSINELAQSLALQTTTFASYLLSFGILGVFWYRHNLHSHHFRVITRPMLVLHFVQLAAAAFFPFCAAIFGRYHFNPLAVLIYLGCVVVYLWASLGNWVIARRTGAMSFEIVATDYQRSRNHLIRGCVLTTGLSIYYLFMIFAR